MQVNKELAFSNPYLLNDKLPCDFKVIDAVPTEKNSFEAMNLKVKVTDSHGKSTNMFATLTIDPSHIHEIGAFAIAVGLEQKVKESGKLLPADCLNKEGKCSVRNGKNKMDQMTTYFGKWLPPKENHSGENAPVLNDNLGWL